MLLACPGGTEVLGMDTIRELADHAIRRALGFAGLGVALTVLALAFDPVMALRTGAVLTAAVWAFLWLSALRAPHRDIRRTELWIMLSGSQGDMVRRLLRGNPQDLLGTLLRDRLLWHADRVAAVALSFWTAALLVALKKSLL
jgi:hypothetical protein